MWLKQSTAVTVKMGPFVDSTDGNTQETALTISQADIRLSKNGGAYAQTNNATGATHDEKGNYGVPLDTTDTNTLGTLRVHIHESGALPVWQDFMVVPANVWDSMFGADLLDISVVQIAGSAVSTTTAQLGVNAVQAGGTAWGSGAITAAAIATGAIDADAIADGAIDAGAIAADAITAAKIADGAIDAATFAAGAINAAAIAADAITDAKVASDVTIASVTGAVGSVTGAVGSVTGNVGGNVTGSVGSVVGAVGSVTGNVGGNVTGTVGGFTTAAKAEIEAEANDALVGQNLDHLVKIAVDTNFATTVHADSVLGQIADNGAGYDRTTDSLEAIRDRGDAAWTGGGSAPTAAEVADAVWDEATSGHTTSGTFGQQVKTDIDDILVDTAEIGAAGAGLTGLGGMSATMKGQVQTEVGEAMDETIADSVPADGTRPSVRQALYMIIQMMTERDVTNTTVTVKKPDGSTTLMTLTLNSSTSPTSITRSG